MASDIQQIQALLQEREGYIARKLHLRVAAVDAALKLLGHVIQETATAPAATERASKPAATKRNAK